MNKKIIGIGIVLILLTIGLSGCQEEIESIFDTSTEVSIVVRAICVIHGLNESVSVRFDITKTGGLTYTQYQETAQQYPLLYWAAFSTDTTYLFHEGETIMVEISLSGVEAKFASEVRTLRWDEVKDECDKSLAANNTYYWVPEAEFDFRTT